MTFRLSRLLVTLMLCVSIGLHWALLQTVAWVSMLADFTGKTGSIAEAASMTFDGEHACPLCRAIAEGKAREEGKSAPGKDDRNSLKKDTGKMFLVEVDPAAFICLPEVCGCGVKEFSIELVSAAQAAPPVPPPRLV